MFPLIVLLPQIKDPFMNYKDKNAKKIVSHSVTYSFLQRRIREAPPHMMHIYKSMHFNNTFLRNK